MVLSYPNLDYCSLYFLLLKIQLITAQWLRLILGFSTAHLIIPTIQIQREVHGNSFIKFATLRQLRITNSTNHEFIA